MKDETCLEVINLPKHKFRKLYKKINGYMGHVSRVYVGAKRFEQHNGMRILILLLKQSLAVIITNLITSFAM